MKTLSQFFKSIVLFSSFLALSVCSHEAYAHPMGNFSINHYSKIEVGAKKINVRFLIDFAEIPTVTLKGEEDTNSDGKISDLEMKSYLDREAPKLLEKLSLAIDGKPAPLTLQGVKQEFREGAGGLQTTRLSLSLTASTPANLSSSHTIVYKDTNYTERTGWKEIVAISSASIKLTQNSASSFDRSKELTSYPTDPGNAPPQQTEATLTVMIGGTSALIVSKKAEPTVPKIEKNAGLSSTPQDPFTQSISTKQLSLGVVLISLGLAFVFGAFHALAPGHGKAMVAAYLVGARGTIKHAFFLGGVVTITHTIGVFLLGVLTLAAAKYVVPEKFYPFLSGISGISIVIVGATLFWQRLKLVMKSTENNSHEHTHDHDPAHDHYHAHDGGHDHGDGHHHHHMPIDAEVSLKSLLVLGLTGGALPCPSALVVMLSAIALHRIAFGLALISAFSLGLAAVLVAIGALVVKLKGQIEKLPLEGKLIARLPLVSAALVTIVGIVLVFRSVTGKF